MANRHGTSGGSRKRSDGHDQHLQRPAIPGVLSPPQQVDDWQQGLSTEPSPFDKYHGVTVPAGTAYNNPLTPPHIGGDLDLVQKRNAENPAPSTSSLGPSPGWDGITPVDPDIVEKKERLARKGELARQRKRQNKAVKKISDSLKKAETAERKRKAKSQPPVPPTAPPSLRIPQAPQSQHFQAQSGQYYNQPSQPQYDQYGAMGGMMAPPQHSPYHNPYSPYPYQHPPGSTQRSVDVVMTVSQDGYTQASGYNTTTDTPASTSSLAQPDAPVTAKRDVGTQGIVSDYGDYKWDVVHYVIPSNGTFAYAQAWLEDVCSRYLLPADYKWHAHSSQGYIENGTRLSFIVVHNAADPFNQHSSTGSSTAIGMYKIDHRSSTSIATYGIDHDEIHWKTFMPDMREVLRLLEENNQCHVLQRWTAKNPNPAEARFHRAYWLAARGEPLGRLLNRGKVDVDDLVIEDDGEKLEISDEDLQTNEVGSIKDAKKAGADILKEVEGCQVGEGGWDHVYLGSSGDE